MKINPRKDNPDIKREISNHDIRSAVGQPVKSVSTMVLHLVTTSKKRKRGSCEHSTCIYLKSYPCHGLAFRAGNSCSSTRRLSDRSGGTGMRMSGEKTQYACLTDGCKQIFGTYLEWCAKPHAAGVQLQLAQAKHQTKQKEGGGAHILRPGTSCHLCSHYARTDPFGQHKRTTVFDAVIRPHYCTHDRHHFPFKCFGYGTLECFLERNSLEEVGHMQSLGLR